MWNKNRVRNKRNAVRVEKAGIWFSSKLESAVHDILLLREKAGEISNIRCQHTVELVSDIKWRVDFSFEDLATGKTIWCEAKGLEDGEYRNKKKLWYDFGPGALEVWKGSHTKPKLVEIINPTHKYKKLDENDLKLQVMTKPCLYCNK